MDQDRSVTANFGVTQVTPAPVVTPATITPPSTPLPPAPVSSYLLTVKIVDAGSVSSQPSGVDNCQMNCTNYFSGSVILTATPTHSADFIGWSRNCVKTGTYTCKVTIDQIQDVTATFKSYNLTVKIDSPYANNSVSISTVGGNAFNNCFAGVGGNFSPNSCQYNYFSHNTSVTLQATAQFYPTQYHFVGFSNNCVPNGTVNTCVVKMNDNQAVTATFR